jgi:hypothetical protein
MRHACERAVPPKPYLSTALFFNLSIAHTHLHPHPHHTYLVADAVIPRGFTTSFLTARPSTHANRIRLIILEILAAWSSVLHGHSQDHGRFHPDRSHRASVATRKQDHGGSWRSRVTRKENLPISIPRRQELHHRASQQALRSEERLSRLQGAARDCCAFPLPRCQHRAGQSQGLSHACFHEPTQHRSEAHPEDNTVSIKCSGSMQLGTAGDLRHQHATGIPA